MPLTWTRPSVTASAQPIRPVASASQVSGDISTTFGGFPLVCRGPGTHWIAPYGGTRTSTDRPGARSARTANKDRTASRNTDLSGVRPSSSADNVAATAADLMCGEDTTGRYDPQAEHMTPALGRADPVRQGIVADGVFVP